MDKKKNILYNCLYVIVLLSFFIFWCIDSPRYNSGITMFCIHLAEQCTNVKLYKLSNLCYNVAIKISNKPTVWLDYNIAKNIINEQWKAPLTPKKKAKLEAAIKHLDIEIEKHPNNADINAQYAYAYHLMHDFDKAIEYYEKVIKKIPNWEYGLNELSKIYCGIKFDYKKALEYLDRKMAIHIDSGYYGDYFAKASILMRLKKNKEAIDYYKKYIEHNPRHVAGYVNIAICEIAEGRFKDAEMHVNEGLKLAPGFSYLLNSKIDILQHEHKFDEAKNLAMKLLKQNKYNYYEYWQLAELERYKGNIAEAERLYQKSKENAQEYYDKFCEDPYDFDNYDGLCGNRYRFLKDFEQNKKEPLNF